MAAGLPAAQASYTGTYAPPQTVKPHVLVPPTLTCTTPNNDKVALNWSDTDATTVNPYSTSTYWATGYVVERKLNSAAWSTIATPIRTDTGPVTDNSFGILGLSDVVTYRMHSTKSTNWVSGDSNVLTAHVTSLLIFVHVTCS
jgi:hypothetical protein